MNILQSLRFDSTDALGFLRTRFIQALAIAGSLSSIGGIIAQIAAEQVTVVGITITASLVITSAIAYWLTLVGRSVLASVILIVTFSLTLWSVNLIPVLLLLGVLTLIFASALPSRTLYLLVNIVVFSKPFYELARLVRDNGFETSTDGLYLSTSISALFIVSIATRLFINSAERVAQAASRTSSLLSATAEIGQVTSNLLKQDELFNRAVEMIRDRFNFYHVQIFMIDEDRKYARLVASTGEVGQKLLARNHRLAVGSQSVIGRVTQIGETVVASDTDKDAVHAVNELLPNTRSELALPIIDSGQIIGALDVQSTDRNAFTPSDIQALQVMANQLATVIRNARLFEEREANFQLSQRLLLEARTNLREIQRLNSQLSKNAWEEYLGGKQEQPGVILAEDEPQISGDWTHEMVEAVNAQRPVTRREGERRITAVPIVLRGEVLGAIEVESDEVRENDLAEMVQAVAQNLATSLESARLFEEAQEATAQEQRINAITEKYQAAATVDDLLRITIDELSRTLGAAEGAIRVGNLNIKPNDRTDSNRVKLNGHRLNGGGNHD
jgi:GAF domain-containing protein